jgi:hypothetical protein
MKFDHVQDRLHSLRRGKFGTFTRSIVFERHLTANCVYQITLKRPARLQRKHSGAMLSGCLSAEVDDLFSRFSNLVSNEHSQISKLEQKKVAADAQQMRVSRRLLSYLTEQESVSHHYFLYIAA